MQAVNGFYDNGIFELNQEAPVKRGKFIMFFTEEEEPAKTLMSKEEAMRIFKKYSGSIDKDIDIQRERDEYLYEKYGPFN